MIFSINRYFKFLSVNRIKPLSIKDKNNKLIYKPITYIFPFLCKDNNILPVKFIEPFRINHLINLV